MQDTIRPGSGRTTRRRLLRGSLAAVAALVVADRASAAHAIRPWPASRATPALNLTDLDGKAWALEAFRGRPVILNFWATWCEPCRAEMPSLEALGARHEKAGLVVLTVNYQEPVPKIRRFLESTPLSLPILLDRDGEAAAAWTTRVFPTTVLIDRQGQARGSVLGELDWLGVIARGLVQPLLAPVKAA